MPVTPERSVAQDVERLIVEQAQAFTQELWRVAQAAPDGQVLRLAELFVVEQGRELLRSALEKTLQAQAAALEKKGRPHGPVPVVSAATTKAGRVNNA